MFTQHGPFKIKRCRVRYLERGEHDAVLSVLNTGVHQVFDQAHLRAQVPDPEGTKHPGKKETSEQKRT